MDEKFKFITPKQIDAYSNSDTNIYIEIAYQLKRIANNLEER